MPDSAALPWYVQPLPPVAMPTKSADGSPGFRKVSKATATPGSPA
ncbi:hypothetical protein AB0F16_08015 [Streptomyces tanashiensis]